jgi:hypothetical protein
MIKVSGIYALVENNTGRLRYIGQSVNIHKRFLEHKNKNKSLNIKSRYGNWIRSIDRDISLMIIEETKDLDKREKFWIKSFLENGADLVNTAKGGEGYPKTPVHRLARVLRFMFDKKSDIQKTIACMLDNYKKADKKEKQRLDNRAAILLGGMNE